MTRKKKSSKTTTVRKSTKAQFPEGKIIEINGEKWYLGLKAIAKRLGYKDSFPSRAQILKHGLLAIKGYLPGGRTRGQYWYISDSLIQAWYVGKAAISREELKHQRIATHEERRNAKRHAAREKERDTRVAVGPNGNKPIPDPALRNEGDNPNADKEDTSG